jgi:vancomycin resistance protein YoaR
MNTEVLKRPFVYINAHKKPIIITIGIILFINLLLCGSYFAFAKAYKGRVYPNIYIGVVNVGGLTEIDAAEILNQHIDSMLDNGIEVSLGDRTMHLDLRKTAVDGTDLSHDLIYYDSNDLTKIAMGVGRGESIWRNLITPLYLIKPYSLDALPEIDNEYIKSQINESFGDMEIEAIPADYKITKQGDDFSIEFIEGADGKEISIAYEETLFHDAADLELGDLKLELREIRYEMTNEDALKLIDQIKSILLAAPFSLTYKSETMHEYSWEITQEDLMDWLFPIYYYLDDSGKYPSLVYSENTFAGLGLGGNKYDEFITGIESDVNIDPIDARFVMENGIVTEFRGSQNGIEFDDNATIGDLLDIFDDVDDKNPQTTLEITVKSTPPDIAIEDVNDFGIKEIIGVGTSTFYNSPSNRMTNIAHGSAKLNGLLVAPGETISLIEHLRPFTLEDGYLPEMVILGDEIKPEIGGGLCQIGTTAFRAVMNSGMQVDERRNHSLVVSYYNDPSNGNPGTDATLYDPYPDLKFTNTYDNYVLLTTMVDVPSRYMEFTFWGTEDGRHGYYTPPVVLSWVPYGEDEYKETLDLEPGVEKCQSAHPGATTQFTYLIDYADGTQFSQVFTSVYRALQKICLVGVEELTVGCPEGEVCE